MHDVHTFMRRDVPPTLACTTWRLGLKRRGVRRCEWETRLPKPGPLPQMSQTEATGSLLSEIEERDAAQAPPGPEVEGYPTRPPAREPKPAPWPISRADQAAALLRPDWRRLHRPR